MPVKKLSIKKGKKGKLVVHKEPTAETDDEAPTLKLEEDPPPFEPDEEEVEPGEPVEIATKPKKTFGKGKVGKPIQGTVGIKEQDSPEEVNQVDVEGAESVQPEGKPMANVGYGLDRTINLGNYESLKIHVTLYVPSEVDEAEIEGNYNFCKGWVEKKMEEVISDFTDD